MTKAHQARPRFAIAASAGMAAICALLFWSPSGRAQSPVVAPAPLVDATAAPGPETLVLAGGCFWGIQGVFQHIKGVTSAVSGYAGGSAQNAHYELVSTGETGAAESVKITFDPKVVSFGRLLQIFFSVALDPTEINRQGPDEGTQYRSAIFPINHEQAGIAANYIAQLDKAHVFHSAIATKIEPFTTFFPAEAYHQNFLNDNPTNPYIVFNDLPKVQALQRLFPADYRVDPILVVAKN